jgi:hypothetical protein
VESIQTVTTAEILNILHRIEGFGAFLTNPDELLHRPHLLVALAEVTLPNGFAHEFGDGRLAAPCSRVKGIPEVFVKVQLRSPHNVYYTSLG